MRYLYIGITCILIFGCTNKTSIPKGILPKDKMEAVLFDMIQADRFAAQYIVKDSTIKNVKKETFTLYEKVFALHNISSQDFVKSYKFYLSRPDLTKVMFDSLSSKANRRKRDVYQNLK